MDTFGQSVKTTAAKADRELYVKWKSVSLGLMQDFF